MNERPKFSLAVGDQPVAVAVASPPADKFDARSINRKAVAAWPILFHMLVDIRGFPNGDIWALNPANPPIDPNRRRQDGPRLVAFSGVNYWENEDGSGPGAWTNRLRVTAARTWSPYSSF
jgi:hypothetical protein